MEPKPIPLYLLRPMRRETKTYSPIPPTLWNQDLFSYFSYAMKPKPIPYDLLRHGNTYSSVSPTPWSQNLFPYFSCAVEPKPIPHDLLRHEIKIYPLTSAAP